jgi:hypothetical protein
MRPQSLWRSPTSTVAMITPVKATLVWQRHNTCLDLPSQPRYRGICMCFWAPRIEIAPHWPLVAGTFGRGLPRPQNGQPGGKETLLDEYDSANLPQGSYCPQSDAGCLLELVK